MSKAQQKKQQRQQLTQLLNQKRKLQVDAEECKDYLGLVPLFRKFNKNGVELTLSSYTHCPDELKDWVFDLTSRNMRKMYEETWGWTDSKKKQELFDDKARYIIAFEGEKPVGFVHFRFELELNVLQSYVYELQVEPDYQSKGIGKFLMQAVEMIGYKLGMEMVVLTVFKINERAMRFYQKLNYKVHERSPSICDKEHADEYHHEALFKSLKKTK